MTERIRDIAHIGPIELRTPTLEASCTFFVNQLGFSVVEQSPEQVLVRSWDEYQRFSIRLIQATQPGIGRTYLRTASAEALDRRVAAVEAAGGVRDHTHLERVLTQPPRASFGAQHLRFHR